MNDDSNRIDALDFLRGLAVMGILLANIVSFALPSAALLNPFTVGTDGPADLATWLFGFLLVDGKFRALFALMFGASILLVMESAELSGRDGFHAHRRRMLWLLPIGIAHFILLWSGDILVPLAIGGLIATYFVRLETLSLIKLALAFLGMQWAINIAVEIAPFWLRSAAMSPDAGAQVIAHWREFADALGYPGSKTVAAETAQYLSGYGPIVGERLNEFGMSLVSMLLYALPETLAFMALGMAMLKGGFLAGQWTSDQYRATWKRAYLVGLVPIAAFGAWILIGRDPLVAEASGFAWTVPFRLPLAAAHAALAMDLAIRFPEARLVAAVRAIGRLALSNYLLTSLLMTTLFYGYGAGLFAQFGRLDLLLIVLAAWALMLLWSSLWRQRFRQGPAEWLWRRVARGKA
jgi:uncharacterized protein